MPTNGLTGLSCAGLTLTLIATGSGESTTLQSRLRLGADREQCRGTRQEGYNPKLAQLARHSRAGFTLLELLVVIVIIGLLAGYVAPRYFAQEGKSKVQVARAQIDAFDKALDQYRLDTGHYPSTEQGLGALVARPNNEPKWGGPYLRKAVPPDPWDHPYIYRQPGEQGEYDLISLGKDGQPGGTGEDADITNH